MVKRPGQAVRWTLHLAGEIVLGLILVLLVAAGVLAWRLAEGPIDLSFLAPRLSAALAPHAGSVEIRIGAVSLAWEGFRRGIESPLELVLADAVLTRRNHSGRVTIPRAEVSLSVPRLLIGRIAPRRVVIEAPRLHFVLGKTGGLALFFGERGNPTAPSPGTARLAGELLDTLATPPGNTQSPAAKRFPALSELTTLIIRDADVTVIDQRHDLTWFAPAAELDLERRAEGGLSGRAHLALKLKDHSARLSVEAHLTAHRGLTVAAHLQAMRPAELAALAPNLAPLSAVDAPVRLELELAFGTGFDLQNADLTLTMGSGRIAFGGGSVPIADAKVKLASAGEDAVKVNEALVHLAGPKGKSGPVLRADGSAFRDAEGAWRGDLAFAADAVPMGDLGRYWPPDIARGGRKWVTENITAGVANRAAAAISFIFAPGNDSLLLESGYGEVPASGLVVHWLRPIAPLTDGTATLSIESPDALSIAVQHASQGRLQVSAGTVRISGLEENNQIGAITARVSGPLPDALTLLADPRLRLLSRHPLPLSKVEGQTDATISVVLPLLDKVTMDQVELHAQSELTQVRIGEIAGGLGLTAGKFSLSADNDGMSLAGSGALAGIATHLRYTMDFRAGPPTSVNQRLEVNATVTAAALAHAGIIDATALIEGPMALTADFDIARDAAAKVRLGVGLTEARLGVAPLGFVKAPGVAARASAEVTLAGQRITGINAFALSGAGISITGTANFAHGTPNVIRIDRAEIGRTHASGSVRFPESGKLMDIAIQGTMLDLSPHFAHSPATQRAPVPSRNTTKKGIPWLLDARFGRILLAHGETLTGGTLSARSNGTIVTEAKFGASLGHGQPLTLHLVPSGVGRSLSITTPDAGDLLAALDVTARMHGGNLALTAAFNDSAAGRPLAGTANISNFSVKDAPVLGKVLQAMTLYGLAEAMSGPGLVFSQLIAPFQYSNNILTLQDARAFSASLGLTGAGTIDLANQTTTFTGTVVPAYFFNSLLGRIPLIGRLFSPEKGGGLFAATYKIEGPLANPKVVVNPLAALTPGILRGLFHIFD